MHCLYFVSKNVVTNFFLLLFFFLFSFVFVFFLIKIYIFLLWTLNKLLFFMSLCFYRFFITILIVKVLIIIHKFLTLDQSSIQKLSLCFLVIWRWIKPSIKYRPNWFSISPFRIFYESHLKCQFFFVPLLLRDIHTLFIIFFHVLAKLYQWRTF